jgi:Protein of unknown function (DUF3455)
MRPVPSLPTLLVCLLTGPLLTAPSFAQSQDPAQDKTQPPAGATLATDPVLGHGVQIYRCQQQTTGPAWTFIAPEATLETPQGTEVGKHGAGPVWRWKDGSAVVGKVAEKQPSPDGHSIPWLLLTTVPAADSAPDGVLYGVTYVRRADTQGGAAPAASDCDASHVGTEARVPYAATYYFYKTETKP